jgi:hypothetical protein
MWLVQLKNSPEKVESLYIKTNKSNEHESEANASSLYNSMLHQRPFAYLQIIRIVWPTFTLSTVLECPPPTNQLNLEELWKVRLGQVSSAINTGTWILFTTTEYTFSSANIYIYIYIRRLRSSDLKIYWNKCRVINS